MTRTDHAQWASARVEQVELKTSTFLLDGRSVPVMTVEVRYSWKDGRFTKSIQSVLN